MTYFNVDKLSADYVYCLIDNITHNITFNKRILYLKICNFDVLIFKYILSLCWFYSFHKNARFKHLSHLTVFFTFIYYYSISNIVLMDSEEIMSTIEFFTIRISVTLSDRSEVTQHKINFVKNHPQWGLNSQPTDHQSHALPTVLARNLLEISEVSFLLFHAPLHMLDLVYF